MLSLCWQWIQWIVLPIQTPAWLTWAGTTLCHWAPSPSKFRCHIENRKQIHDRRSTYFYYETATIQVVCHGSDYHLDHRKLLTRKSIVGDATQVVLQNSLWKHTPYFLHHQPFLEQPGQRQNFVTIRWACYWSRMARVVSVTGTQCTSCGRHERQYIRKRFVQLFSRKRSIGIFTVDILGSLLNTSQ